MTEFKPSRRWIPALVLAGLGALLPSARAQDYPNKPVTVLVAYAPGGYTGGLMSGWNVLVIGGGHAGLEAAWAAAKFGGISSRLQGRRQ